MLGSLCSWRDSCARGTFLAAELLREARGEVRGEARDFRERLAAREDFKLTCTHSSQHSHANPTSHAG